jgi:hypothetical protein
LASNPYSLNSRRLILCCAAVWLTGLLTFEYHSRIEAPAIEKRIQMHTSIVEGTAPYQVRYRILIPNAAEVLANLIQRSPIASSRPPVGAAPYSERAFALAYVLLNSVAFLILFLALGELMWRLFRFDLALLGMAVSGLLVSLTFRDHYFHPWSPWEGALFAVGLLLIHVKSYKTLCALVLLGLLNRETCVFLLLAFLFCTLPADLRKGDWRATLGRRDFRYAAGTLVLWVIGFFVLHQVVGYRPSTFFIETAVRGNRSHLTYAVLLNVLLFGPLWPFMIKGLWTAPFLIRRSAMMLPAYFGLLLVIGYWWEIRYWISVIPVVVPALIAAIQSAMPPGGSGDLEHAAERA